MYDNEPTLYERHQASAIDNYLADPGAISAGLRAKKKEKELYNDHWEDHLSKILDSDFARVEDFLVVTYKFRPTDYAPYEVRAHRHSSAFPRHIWEKLIADLLDRGHDLEVNIEHPLHRNDEIPPVPCAS